MNTKSQAADELNQGAGQDYNYDFGNFNPNDVEVPETINAVFVIDTSSSVHAYVKELNSAINDFTVRMQKSHAAPNLFVSMVEFNDDVTVTSGFRPISEIQPIDLASRIGGYTALYKACDVSLKNAIDYRKDLEQAGVNCKTLLFIITDGEDNASGSVTAADVKAKIDTLMQEERNLFSFESILFGVGNANTFEAAQKDMGIHKLAQVGTTADEIRKMINFISSSITNVSTGQGMSAPNF
jgi:uncharacterized protein YegL